MTLRELLENEEVTAVEYAQDVIFSLVIGESLRGLPTDTSSVVGGTSLIRSENFEVTDTHLSVDEGVATLSLDFVVEVDEDTNFSN